jgi:hypothetical protein
LPRRTWVLLTFGMPQSALDTNSAADAEECDRTIAINV